LWDVVRAHAARGVAPSALADAYAWSLGVTGVSSGQFVVLDEPAPLVVESAADADALARSATDDEWKLASVRDATSDATRALFLTMMMRGRNVWFRQRCRLHRPDGWATGWALASHVEWDAIRLVRVTGSDGAPYAASCAAVLLGHAADQSTCFDDWSAVPMRALRCALAIRLDPEPPIGASITLEFLGMYSRGFLRIGPHSIVHNTVPADSDAHHRNLRGQIRALYGVAITPWCVPSDF